MSDLVKRLRERADAARVENNMTASCDADHFEEAADRIEALEAEVEKLKKLDTYEAGYSDGEGSGAADIDVAREESEDIGYANGRADAENTARKIIEAMAAEIARLSMPKPPGYEHLSHETIDAIRATSTKPK